MPTILNDFTIDELTEFITANFHVKPYVAKQLFSWLIKGADFDAMTNLSKSFRQQLKDFDCVAVSAKIVKTLSAADGTQKFLFELYDGNVVEGVLMRPSLSSPPPVAPEPMGATLKRLLKRTLFLPT